MKKNLPTKSSLLLLPFFNILKIVVLIPFTESKPISFDFPTFSIDTSALILQGNAVLLNGSISITDFTEHSVGHVMYYEPLQLYDNHGNLASFSTDFSFVIDAKNTNPHGDGFTFFIVPNTSSLPNDYYEGSNLGLVSSSDQLLNSDGTFVAVEFDTYLNEWDPEGDHVGIDINFLKSIVFEQWATGGLDGRVSRAWISYESSTSMLDVRFTNFTSGNRDNATFGQLTYQVNLSQVLGSEWVTFGFSASTGWFKEQHKILSWKFDSTFQNSSSPIDLVPVAAPWPEVLLSQDKHSKMLNPSSIAWGTGLGVGVSVLGIVITGWLHYKRKFIKGEDGFEFPIAFDEGLNRESPLPNLPSEMPILRYVGAPLIDIKASSELSSYAFTGSSGFGQTKVDVGFQHHVKSLSSTVGVSEPTQRDELGFIPI